MEYHMFHYAFVNGPQMSSCKYFGTRDHLAAKRRVLLVDVRLPLAEGRGFLELLAKEEVKMVDWCQLLMWDWCGCGLEPPSVI